MKISKYISRAAFVLAMGLLTVSCDDFLDKPSEDQYNNDNFYADDAKC